MLKRNITNLIILAFLSAGFIPSLTAQAAGDLSVQFEQTPLFSNLNFLPGESVLRWVKVTNNGAYTRQVLTRADGVDNSGHLGEVTHLIIKENGSELWTGTMAEFFQAEEIALGDLASGETKQYDYLISFDNSAGNEYQAKTMSFNLVIGFEGGDDETDGQGSPVVQAKWEMFGSNGLDDSSDALAQFLPSGQYQVGKTIKVCVIVTDPEGVADVNGVYGNIFYPEAVSLGPNHESGRQGCGQLVEGEFSLTKLSKSAGYDLFCNKIRNNNNNLPKWHSGVDYDKICALDGELKKDLSLVYCGEKTLSYEDPSGDYRSFVYAQDQGGLSGTLQSYFKYLDVTAFETDFNSISYGQVRINTNKIISGDLTWGNSLATVRNIGNTRLKINVWQTDMGLGKTDGLWNVKYGGRLGGIALFGNYVPAEDKILADSLNLSQMNEMDFSIEVAKFPPTHVGDNYVGAMVLSAIRDDHLVCEAKIGVGGGF